MKKILLVIVVLFIVFLGVNQINNKEVLSRNFIEEVESNGINLSEIDAVYVTFPLEDESFYIFEDGTFHKFAQVYWYDKADVQLIHNLLNSAEFEHDIESKEGIDHLVLRFYGRYGAEFLFSLRVNNNSFIFSFGESEYITRTVNTEQIFVGFANLIEKFYEEKNLPPKKMKITPLTTEWMSKYK